ncbi:CheR family methyltransferase [Fulvivirgaceae bacterium BMA12]|uniref:CheR family methyltransferase n=1 Tax=Agaribacillus aureus TaxID=3051825 RepID=A0ABT8L5I5_9BACT|nr:CheR family methyltransferase [Fulvivirgaceae bacterium BMA12]
MDITKNDKFYVVGIGASAGGLDPIQKVFDIIPRYSKAAFVVVQHLSPDFVSLMDELLRKHTDMKVSTAVDNELILANRVYLVPRKKFIKVEKNRFVITDKESKTLDMPIDVFFHSLGKSYKEKAIGIILSGSGTDGSRGIRTIIEKGGIAMAQDPYSAQFDGMPNAAIHTDLVDFMGTPSEIAQRLVKICMGNKSFVEPGDPLGKSGKLSLTDILSTIYTKRGMDFKFYKQGTLSRIIEKRIHILSLENINEYHNYLINDENETNILAKEFLIGVTKFFRNQEAFKAIENKVLPSLFQHSQGLNPIRIWVMACSTGEEAYSLSILLNEYKRKKKLDTKFKIFASDIDESAISKAQQGIYGDHLKADIPADLRERYFKKLDGKYEVVKEIRENIVFAVHNVLKDPPFINMDLIVSRNFLIYINTKPQKIVLDKFHYSLNTNGFLFLGSSESLQGKEEEFEVIDAKWRIFRCKKSLSKPVSELTLKEIDPIPLKSTGPYERIQEKPWLKSIDAKPDYNELLIKHYAPPACLMVNKDLDVLHVVGEVEEFLQFPTTPSDFNLNAMIEKNQLVVFKNGVKEALAKNKSYAVKGFPFQRKGKNSKINVKFTPKWVELKQSKMVLIEFLSRDNASRKEVEAFFSKEDHTKEQIKILELELLEAKQKLKINHEKYELTNEELQAANEELMSSNEEMQSTNEELQSVNVELYTVNAELNAKIKELRELNNDINNLLSSTDIGTIFLDNDLKIRKFTPAVKYQFNIVNSDLGRPIYHFSSYFGFKDFKQQIFEVMSSLKSTQVKIKNESGRAYLMKINPFITSEQEVMGVVISFVDIDELSKKQGALEESEDH